MLKTERTKLQELYNHKLSIPDYQRAYSWNKKQVRQFFEDLEYAVENDFENDPERYHYFGTIVLEDNGKSEYGSTVMKNYDIVDGQQRILTTSIFIRALIDYIQDLSYDFEDVDNFSVENLTENLYETFIQTRGILRIEPEDISKDAFKEYIVKDDESNSIQVNSNKSLPHRKIQTAYIELYSCLESYMERRLTNESTSEDVYKEINKLVRTLKTEFRLTPNILTDMNEASRMFKVINDRGKDLTTLDKIKSHLMYCCTFFEENEDSITPQNVTRYINKAVQKITKIPESEEKDIDKFVKIHWYLFTGEDQHHWSKSFDSYDEDYRRKLSMEERMQELPFYASISQDETRLKKFIGNYVTSLSELADQYIKFEYPDYCLKEDLITRKMHNYIYILHKSGTKSPYGIYTTGLMYAFDDDTKEDQKKIESALRTAATISLRYHQIHKNSGSFSNMLSNLGHKIFWIEYQSDPDAVTKNELYSNRTHANHELYTTKQKWLNKSETELQDKIKNKCDIDSTKNRLSEYDIIKGDFTDGWGGVRSRNTIKTILYIYENHLREDKLKDKILLKNWCEKLELEHILPENPDKKISYHDKQVNKLGNFLVLTPESNKNASNKPFKQKLTEVYETEYDIIEMKKELENHKEWTSTTIKNRSDKIMKIFLQNF